MDQYRYEVGLDIRADISQAKKEIDVLKKSLQEIQKASLNPLADNTGGALTKAAGSARSLQSALAAAANVDTGRLDFSKFNQQLAASGTSIKEIYQSFDTLQGNGTQAINALNSLLLRTQAEVQNSNTWFTKFATTLKNTFTWTLASQAIRTVQGQITSAISYVEDLNKTLTDIRIVTGKSIEDMVDFTKVANSAAKELATTTKAFSEASLIYFQQGDSQADAIKKATITQKAANVAFSASAKEMSEMLTAVWNSYQAGTDQLQEYVDIMAALGASTASSTEEIATAMQKVAATANTVGVSMKQMSSIISTVASVTREAPSSIGTAYKTILARMSDLKAGETLEDGLKLGAVSSQLSAFGINILDAQQNLRDMGTVIDEIGTKWETFTTAQKTALAQVLGGKRQYTSLMALFENFDKYRDAMQIAENSAGTLEKQNRTYLEGYEAAAKATRASMEELWSTLINDQAMISFQKTLSKALDTVNNIVKGFGGLPGIILSATSAINSALGSPIISGLIKGMGNFAQGAAFTFNRGQMSELLASELGPDAKSLTRTQRMRMALTGKMPNAESLQQAHILNQSIQFYQRRIDEDQQHLGHLTGDNVATRADREQTERRIRIRTAQMQAQQEKRDLILGRRAAWEQAGINLRAQQAETRGQALDEVTALTTALKSREFASGFKDSLKEALLSGQTGDFSIQSAGALKGNSQNIASVFGAQNFSRVNKLLKDAGFDSVDAYLLSRTKAIADGTLDIAAEDDYRDLFRAFAPIGKKKQTDQQLYSSIFSSGAAAQAKQRMEELGFTVKDLVGQIMGSDEDEVRELGVQRVLEKFMGGEELQEDQVQILLDIMGRNKPDINGRTYEDTLFNLLFKGDEEKLLNSIESEETRNALAEYVQKLKEAKEKADDTFDASGAEAATEKMEALKATLTGVTQGLSAAAQGFAQGSQLAKVFADETANASDKAISLGSSLTSAFMTGVMSGNMLVGVAQLAVTALVGIYQYYKEIQENFDKEQIQAAEERAQKRAEKAAELAKKVQKNEGNQTAFNEAKNQWDNQTISMSDYQSKLMEIARNLNDYRGLIQGLSGDYNSLEKSIQASVRAEQLANRDEAVRQLEQERADASGGFIRRLKENGIGSDIINLDKSNNGVIYLQRPFDVEDNFITLARDNGFDGKLDAANLDALLEDNFISFLLDNVDIKALLLNAFGEHSRIGISLTGGETSPWTLSEVLSDIATSSKDAGKTNRQIVQLVLSEMAQGKLGEATLQTITPNIDEAQFIGHLLYSAFTGNYIENGEINREVFESFVSQATKFSTSEQAKGVSYNGLKILTSSNPLVSGFLQSGKEVDSQTISNAITAISNEVIGRHTEEIDDEQDYFDIINEVYSELEAHEIFKKDLTSGQIESINSAAVRALGGRSQQANIIATRAASLLRLRDEMEAFYTTDVTGMDEFAKLAKGKTFDEYWNETVLGNTNISRAQMAELTKDDLRYLLRLQSEPEAYEEYIKAVNRNRGLNTAASWLTEYRNRGEEYSYSDAYATIFNNQSVLDGLDKAMPSLKSIEEFNKMGVEEQIDYLNQINTTLETIYGTMWDEYREVGDNVLSMLIEQRQQYELGQFQSRDWLIGGQVDSYIQNGYFSLEQLQHLQGIYTEAQSKNANEFNAWVANDDELKSIFGNMTYEQAMQKINKANPALLAMISQITSFASLIEQHGTPPQEADSESIITARSRLSDIRKLSLDPTEWGDNYDKYADLLKQFSNIEPIDLIDMSDTDKQILMLQMEAKAIEDLRAAYESDNRAADDQLRIQARANLESAQNLVSQLQSEQISDYNTQLANMETQWDRITAAAERAADSIQNFIKNLDELNDLTKIEQLRQDLETAGMAQDDIEKLIATATDTTLSDSERLMALNQGQTTMALARMKTTQERMAFTSFDADTAADVGYIASNTDALTDATAAVRAATEALGQIDQLKPSSASESSNEENKEPPKPTKIQQFASAHTIDQTERAVIKADEDDAKWRRIQSKLPSARTIDQTERAVIKADEDDAGIRREQRRLAAHVIGANEQAVIAADEEDARIRREQQFIMGQRQIFNKNLPHFQDYYLELLFGGASSEEIQNALTEEFTKAGVSTDLFSQIDIAKSLNLTDQLGGQLNHLVEDAFKAITNNNSGAFLNAVDLIDALDIADSVKEAAYKAIGFDSYDKAEEYFAGKRQDKIQTAQATRDAEDSRLRAELESSSTWQGTYDLMKQFLLNEGDLIWDDREKRYRPNSITEEEADRRAEEYANDRFAAEQAMIGTQLQSAVSALESLVQSEQEGTPFEEWAKDHPEYAKATDFASAQELIVGNFDKWSARMGQIGAADHGYDISGILSEQNRFRNEAAWREAAAKTGDFLGGTFEDMGRFFVAAKDGIWQTLSSLPANLINGAFIGAEKTQAATKINSLLNGSNNFNLLDQGRYTTRAEMQDAGYTDFEDDYATTYSMSFSTPDGKFFYALSPIYYDPVTGKKSVYPEDVVEAQAASINRAYEQSGIAPADFASESPKIAFITQDEYENPVRAQVSQTAREAEMTRKLRELSQLQDVWFRADELFATAGTDFIQANHDKFLEEGGIIGEGAYEAAVAELGPDSYLIAPPSVPLPPFLDEDLTGFAETDVKEILTNFWGQVQKFIAPQEGTPNRVEDPAIKTIEEVAAETAAQAEAEQAAAEALTEAIRDENALHEWEAYNELYLKGSNKEFEELDRAAASDKATGLDQYFLKHPDLKTKYAFLTGDSDDAKDAQRESRASVKSGRGWRDIDDDIKDSLKEIIQPIFDDYINSDDPELQEIGRNMLRGIIVGFQEAGYEFVNAAEAFAATSIDACCEALGIQSPAKALNFIGEMMLLGVKEGWDQAQADLNFKQLEQWQKDIAKYTQEAFSQTAIGKSAQTMRRDGATDEQMSSWVDANEENVKAASLMAQRQGFFEYYTNDASASFRSLVDTVGRAEFGDQWSTVLETMQKGLKGADELYERFSRPFNLKLELQAEEAEREYRNIIVGMTSQWQQLLLQIEGLNKESAKRVQETWTKVFEAVIKGQEAILNKKSLAEAYSQEDITAMVGNWRSQGLTMEQMRQILYSKDANFVEGNLSMVPSLSGQIDRWFTAQGDHGFKLTTDKRDLTPESMTYEGYRSNWTEYLTGLIGIGTQQTEEQQENFQKLVEGLSDADRAELLEKKYIKQDEQTGRYMIAEERRAELLESLFRKLALSEDKFLGGVDSVRGYILNAEKTSFLNGISTRDANLTANNSAVEIIQKAYSGWNWGTTFDQNLIKLFGGTDTEEAKKFISLMGGAAPSVDEFITRIMQLAEVQAEYARQYEVGMTMMANGEASMLTTIRDADGLARGIQAWQSVDSWDALSDEAKAQFKITESEFFSESEDKLTSVGDQIWQAITQDHLQDYSISDMLSVAELVRKMVSGEYKKSEDTTDLISGFEERLAEKNLQYIEGFGFTSLPDEGGMYNYTVDLATTGELTAEQQNLLQTDTLRSSQLMLENAANNLFAQLSSAMGSDTTLPEALRLISTANELDHTLTAFEWETMSAADRLKLLSGALDQVNKNNAWDKLGGSDKRTNEGYIGEMKRLSGKSNIDFSKSPEALELLDKTAPEIATLFETDIDTARGFLDDKENRKNLIAYDDARKAGDQNKQNEIWKKLTDAILALERDQTRKRLQSGSKYVEGKVDAGLAKEVGKLRGQDISTPNGAAAWNSVIEKFQKAFGVGKEVAAQMVRAAVRMGDAFADGNITAAELQAQAEASFESAQDVAQSSFSIFSEEDASLADWRKQKDSELTDAQKAGIQSRNQEYQKAYDDALLASGGNMDVAKAQLEEATGQEYELVTVEEGDDISNIEGAVQVPGMSIDPGMNAKYKVTANGAGSELFGGEGNSTEITIEKISQQGGDSETQSFNGHTTQTGGSKQYLMPKGTKITPRKIKEPDSNPSKGKGGGGGGGGKKKQQKQTKTSKTAERYHRINSHLSTTSSTLKKLGDVKERVFGKDLLKSMQEENKMLKEQERWYKTLLVEAKEWLNWDRNNLKRNFNIKFDEDGSIQNYATIMNKIVSEFNKATEIFNNSDQDEEMSEWYEQQKEKMEEQVELIKQYEDSLAKVAEAEDNILSTQNQIASNNLELIQKSLENTVKWTESETTLLEYLNSKYEHYLGKQDSILSNYFDTVQLTNDSLGRMVDTYHELQEAYQTGEIYQAQYISGIQDLQQQLLEAMNQIEEMRKNIRELYPNTLSKWNQDIEKNIKLIEQQKSTLSSFVDIVKLGDGGESAYAALQGYMNGITEMNKQMLRVNRQNLDVLEAQLPYYEQQYKMGEITEENYQALLEQIISIREAVMTNTTDALNAAKEEYINAISAIKQELNKQFAGVYDDVGYMQEQFNTFKEIRDEYLTATQQGYEIAKLNRQIDKDRAETESDWLKAQLDDLQRIINAENEQNRLTQYEIDKLNKQYEILKALADLEDARNAKNVVRLTRDENGNFMYQYTADQDKLDDAEQKYEDKVNEMYQLIKNQVDEMQQSVLETMDSFSSKYEEILTDMSLTTEQKVKRIQDLIDANTQKMNFYTEQTAQAINDLNEINENMTYPLYGINNRSTTEEVEGHIAQYLTDYSSLITAAQAAVDAGLVALGGYDSDVAEIMEQADLNDITMDSQMSRLNYEATYAMNNIAGLNDEFTEVSNSIRKMISTWDQFNIGLEQTLQNLQNIYNEMQGIVREAIGDNSLGQYEQIASAATSGVAGNRFLSALTGIAGQMRDISQSLFDPWQEIATSVAGGQHDKPNEDVLRRIAIQEGFDWIRWSKKYATGGLNDFTGPAWLDGTVNKPELVLNSTDTQRMFDIIDAERAISAPMLSNIVSLIGAMANISSNVSAGRFNLADGNAANANVTINADFPNVSSRDEIKAAFGDIMNMASQYINS